MIPVAALWKLGDGSFTKAFTIMTENNPEMLRAAGSASSAIPWSTLFTGILIINLALMMLVGCIVRFVKPIIVKYSIKDTGEVDLVPWKYVWHLSWLIILSLGGLYATFSDIGVIETETPQRNLITIWSVVLVSVITAFVILQFKRKEHKKEVPAKTELQPEF